MLLGPHLGVEPVALRLFNTYGTRQGYTPYVGVLTIFVTRLLSGQPCTIFGDGEQRRDFVHVSDVVRAFRLAADAPDAAGQQFNIGSSTGVSVNELAALLKERFPDAEFRYADADGSEVRHSIADIRKAGKSLGFDQPRQLAENIDDVIDFVRANLS